MRTATVESGRAEQKPPPLSAGAGAPATEPQAGQDPGDRNSEASNKAAQNPLALKNWRVRNRLIALILLPTLVAVTLGGLRVASSISSAAEYQRVKEAAELVASVGVLTHELQLERDYTARFLAYNRHQSGLLSLIRTQQGSVDVAARQFRLKAATAADTLGTVGNADLTRLLGRLDELSSLRKMITSSQLPVLPSIAKYSLLTSDALDLYDASVQGVADESISTTLKSASALAKAKEEVSTQRALLGAGIAKNTFEATELDAFNAARARETSEREAFLTQATPAERQLFLDTVTGQKVDRAEFLKSYALTLTGEGFSLRHLTPGADAGETWFDAASATADDMQKVDAKLLSSVISRSEDFQASDRRVAAINVGMVVAVLLLVLAITSVMARSLVRPLRRLRTEALEVAGHRLPDLVQRLRESEGGVGVESVEPIGVDSADEVGEVARAFDEVHREAVRLAGDEARLRSNINAMFVNLSRRTQTLVERQISLIDGLEQGEQDEGRLGNLFKLDHLATRMRRNSENLLVLAGQESARRWSQPVEITDVIRASLSEVEGYERVTLNSPSSVFVAGQAVNDVIHLLAELVENALAFSARDTRVVVSGNQIDGGGLMVSVTDSGIGMTLEEIAQANWRLAHPPVVDVSVSRRMGLFVVGRLAIRNGIRVQLRPHDGGGLTAMVLLPESLMGRSALQAPQAFSNVFGSTWDMPVEQSGWPQPQPSQSGPISLGSASGPIPMGQASGPMSMGQTDPRSKLRPRRDNVFEEPATGPMPAIGRSTGPMPTMGRSSTGPVPPITAQMPPINGPMFGAGTGPLPTMGAMPNPAPAPTDDFLPIFASVESAWFQRTPPGEEPDQTRGTDSGRQPPADLGRRTTDTGWQPADSGRRPVDNGRQAADAARQAADAHGWKAPDAGWKAAETAVQKPSWEGKTSSGLPKRVPKANLVPGSAEPVKAPSVPPPVLSPDRARSRLSSFQQGVRQGRAVARGEISEAQGYPMRNGDQT